MTANLKTIAKKKPAKDQREKLVLLGLVDLYIRTGKPVGSHTLKENGFIHLSSATIRNYFSKLEESGYLKQQHSSGGRIPTSAAYRLYAEALICEPFFEEKELHSYGNLIKKQTREVSAYLQKCAEILSDLTNTAVFFSSPRFEQDFVLDAKLVNIDQNRLLCILITDFGMIHTEILHTEKKLSSFTLKRIEQFFHWKLTGYDRPNLSQEEEETAKAFYNEAMLRHIVNYTNFSQADIFKTGFSKLLSYPDFNEAASLANGLSFFENSSSLQALLTDCIERNTLSFWVGEDLLPFSPQATSCSVIAIPYYIHNTAVGSFGILSPVRIPYKKLFSYLKITSDVLSDSLTKSLYKYKLTFRQPSTQQLPYQKTRSPILDSAGHFLLEDKTN